MNSVTINSVEICKQFLINSFYFSSLCCMATVDVIAKKKICLRYALIPVRIHHSMTVTKLFVVGIIGPI